MALLLEDKVVAITGAGRGIGFGEALEVARQGGKVVINEFVAYVDLSQHLEQLERHSQIVATYALSGFANFASIAEWLAAIFFLVACVDLYRRVANSKK